MSPASPAPASSSGAQVPRPAGAPQDAPAPTAPCGPPHRTAAYFDLDKTILATSAALALGEPMRRSGLISRTAVARGVVVQLPYLLVGVDTPQANRIMERLARMLAGISRRELRQVVEDALGSAIEPACYAEALQLIAAHQQAGHDVVVVSASTSEIVEPVARMVGAGRAVATRLEVDDEGRFTGRIERSLLHAQKVVALQEDAAAHGIDLQRSWAYSDSVSDEPMLRAVGHPVAANPDRELRRLAAREGWPVRDFVRPVRLRSWAPPQPASGVLQAALLLAVATATGWAVARFPRRRAAAAPLGRRLARRTGRS
ncbi:HAD-IB family hydrolase [Actinomyces bowdenii]|uniref:HAD-IB family hydrolase n=1 Tax=Actinomyces bowdenii TaxID=131109 RepID=A0A3P1V5H4_9ACTO|nr:HAD-IB family hydrolase [Actinomyces bowdenii]MBO3723539.1 HAD-IB family hydrolase [Actinomyces bowdenii]RRD28565.1 HAD-IB family hydrolase [Actinomyces bowdenii]